MHVEQQPSRTIYGIEVCTSNRTPERISQLWKLFLSEELWGYIPERVDGNYLAAYYDYEGDDAQSYTFFVGCEVNDVACCPEEFVLRFIPAGPYAKFHTVDRISNGLSRTWERIRQSPIDRAYDVDFEIHNPSGGVEVFIGILEDVV